MDQNKVKDYRVLLDGQNLVDFHFLGAAWMPRVELVFSGDRGDTETRAEVVKFLESVEVVPHSNLEFKRTVEHISEYKNVIRTAKAAIANSDNSGVYTLLNETKLPCLIIESKPNVIAPINL